MSTFSVFRKNQKTWLAVLGVLTMLSFVFIPTLEQCNRRYVPGNQDYFKTKAFGNLSYSQFDQERQRQNSIYQVFQPNFYGLSEDMVASTWLKAKYAEKFGFVVSDYEIREFISNQFPSAEAYKDALKQFGMTSSAFEEGLKEIILSQKYQNYCLTSVLATKTIEQQWELFSKIYRNAVISVIPVRADDFLTKVSNPSSEKVKLFFNEHKNRLPNKKYGIVGFKTPAKMRIQYLVYQKPVIPETPAAEAAPLPESINLEEATPAEAAPADAAPAEAAPAEAAPAEAAPAEAAPAEAAPAEAAPAEAAPAEAAPAEAAPAEAAPAEAAPAEAAPAEAAPAEAAPAEAAPAEAAPAEAAPAEPSADARTQTPFRLVADETVTTEPAPAETAAEEAPADAAPEIALAEDLYDAKAFLKLVQTDLSAYKNALNRYEFSNDKDAQKPVFEFSAETKAYMEKFGIQFVEMDLMDVETLAEQSIANLDGFERLNAKTFMGIECSDAASEYIVWNAEFIPEEEPKEMTKELTEQAEKAWKFEEAKKMAAEAAQKSADDCAKANALSGVTAPIEIDGFARFKPTVEGYPTVVDLSTYTDLENVAEDFRMGVFQMLPGEIKAFPNCSRTVFYVTQLKSFEPNDEELREMFKNLNSNPIYMYMSQQQSMAELQNEMQIWQNSVFEDAGAYFTSRGREDEE